MDIKLNIDPEQINKVKEEWYWTNEQPASLSSYAWIQSFGLGFQDFTPTGTHYRARAVRRVTI